ncbi:MAG: hypothetical protein EZS28_001449 [Streblomastix strix]|uniref:Uncharacterized protein n=1 Tax=Streblomastix strix TaxID=222440 RepID=A0A5J4X6Z2_9EUKA|nr:MAG: hypothetical protein EZS28_001449 [Streblomastix strix]
MDIELMFRNWSLTYQYTKQFTQLGCTVDLIIGLHAEPLTKSGLKNLLCNIKPVTMSIKYYVITEVTANMAGYQSTDALHNRARQFYSQRPFVVPAQYARATTFFENRCYLNMQVTTCGRNFTDMPINTLDKQFFKLQLNASNLYLLFEATVEFVDALTILRNKAIRRLNQHCDLTSFLITLQCERNSNGALTFDGLDNQNQNASVELRGATIYQGTTNLYYNVDSSGKRPPPPILCTVHDTFWLFSPAADGSCIYDSNYSFDEVIGRFNS